MEIKLTRKHFGSTYSIGDITTDRNANILHSMEDVDRGLVSTMTEDEINAIKVHSKTAIPYGRYEVIVNMSNRFKIELPLLLGVKGFAGIRIHVGNFPTDTEGCLLPGKGFSLAPTPMVTASQKGFGELFELIKIALKNKERVFITVQKEMPNA